MSQQLIVVEPDQWKVLACKCGRVNHWRILFSNTGIISWCQACGKKFRLTSDSGVKIIDVN